MARLPHSTERGRETLRALRGALMVLIVEKGFEAVTIKDITERAGIDRTTFYLHVRDKRELFEVVQRQMIDELFGPDETEPARGQRALIAFHQIAADPAGYRALFTVNDAATTRRLLSYASEHIERLIAASGVITGVPFDLLATYAASAFRGLALWWLEHDQPYPPERMGEMWAGLIIHGLSSFATSAPTPALAAAPVAAVPASDAV